MHLLKNLSGAVTAAIVAGLAGWFMMTHPETPLPPEWNPAVPLEIAAPVTPLTKWKARIAMEGAACVAVLSGADAEVTALPPLVETEACGIGNRVRVARLGEVRMQPVEMDCALALRMALWVEHGLQDVAETTLGSPLSRLEHFSSYSCRTIRTMAGPGTRMSQHATGEAIDISGAVTADGRRTVLKDDWEAGHGFWPAARDSACRFFSTTLGPDFNDLHADHFHLQARGWGTCR